MINTHEIVPFQEQVAGIAITDPKSLAKASEYLSQANIYLDALTADKELITKPLNAAIKEARLKYKPFEDAITSVIASLRTKMTVYQTDLANAEAKEQARIAARLEKGTIKVETALRKLDAIEDVPKNVATESGSVLFVAYPTFEVTSLKDVPMEYHLANETMIRTAMKANIKLPGVRYFTEQRPRNSR